MNLRKGLYAVILSIAVAAQPALAAEASTAKPEPSVQTIKLADVPMKELAAEASSASANQTTRQDNVGFSIEELFAPKTCPSGGNASFTWTIKDGCFDGLGVYVRFFDETNGLVFPNASQAYVINSGRSGTVKLTVKRGAKICYGAEPTNRDGSYWGVGLDNDQGCASCCNIVPDSGNISRSVSLVCD
jgi:hypothetical protein